MCRPASSRAGPFAYEDYSRTDTTPDPVVPVPVVVLIIVAMLVVAVMPKRPVETGAFAMRAGMSACDMGSTIVVRCSGCQQLPNETIA